MYDDIVATSKLGKRSGSVVVMVLMVLTTLSMFATTNVRAVDTDGDGVTDDNDLDPINNLRLTVTIREALQIDPVDAGSDADFYWKVTVAGNTQKSSEPWATNNRHIYPNWAYTWDVSDVKTVYSVHVTIALYDDDGISDDTMDISGSTSKCEIDYDLRSGWWAGTDARYHIDQTTSDDPNGYGHTSGNEDGSWTSDQDDCEVWFRFSQTDFDSDGIPYYQEVYEFGTNPRLQDTDGDGLTDREARYRWTFDPNAWNNPNADQDGDGYTNAQEINTMGTNPTKSDRWAVICIGGNHDAAQDEMENAGDLAHQTLVNRGYSDDHMWFMTSRSTSAGRDQDHGKEFAFLSIESYLHTYSDQDDRIFIYFFNHGEVNTGHFVIHSDTISDTELGVWVNSITTNGGGFSRLVFVMEACYSGNHIDDLQGANRIAITGTSSTQPEPYVVNGRTVFCDSFFGSLGAGNPVETAFVTARAAMNNQYEPDPDPQISDQIAGNYLP